MVSHEVLQSDEEMYKSKNFLRNTDVFFSFFF